MHTHPDHRPSVDLLESTHFFPGVYQIKAIGKAEGDFERRVVDAVVSLLPAASDLDYSVRVTPGGRHIAPHAGYHRANGRAGAVDLRRGSRCRGAHASFLGVRFPLQPRDSCPTIDLNRGGRSHGGVSSATQRGYDSAPAQRPVALSRNHSFLGAASDPCSYEVMKRRHD